MIPALVPFCGPHVPAYTWRPKTKGPRKKFFRGPLGFKLVLGRSDQAAGDDSLLEKKVLRTFLAPEAFDLGAGGNQRWKHLGKSALIFSVLAFFTAGWPLLLLLLLLASSMTASCLCVGLKVLAIGSVANFLPS